MFTEQPSRDTFYFKEGRESAFSALGFFSLHLTIIYHISLGLSSESCMMVFIIWETNASLETPPTA